MNDKDSRACNHKTSYMLLKSPKGLLLSYETTKENVVHFHDTLKCSFFLCALLQMNSLMNTRKDGGC